MATGKTLILVNLMAAVFTLLPAHSVIASPYMTVSVLGSVHGSGDPYASQVFVKAGDVVDYEVRVQLAVQGTSNAFAPAAVNTITRWIPSNGPTSPTDGLNSVGFSLSQGAAAGTIQSDFTSVATGFTTGGALWGQAVGSSDGTLTDRGNGNHDLRKVFLIRGLGDYDGIANDLSPELLSIAGGSFDIASSGTTTTLNVDYSGFTADTIVTFYRWRDAANTTNVNFPQRVSHYNTTVANNDPLVIFNNLTLSPSGSAPEPMTLPLLAGIVVPLLMSRKRRA